MSKNLKSTSPLAKISHFLLAATLIAVLLVGFGIFYEQKFPGTFGWLQLVTRIVGCALVYAWLLVLAAVVMQCINFDPRSRHSKTLLLVAVDAIIGAIMVIILKQLIMPFIANPTVTSWDFLIAGLLFFVALCCVVADYLRRLL